jgi:flagellar hook assembly protein FlgD
MALNMVNLSLSSSVIRPNLSAPASQTSNGSNVALIYIETSGDPVTLTWDATNDGGTIVTPGVYTVEVHWNNGNGETTDITRNIVVMPGFGVNGTAFAGPNVLDQDQGYTTTFDATNVASVTSIKVNVYTITGQLVDQLTSSGLPKATWNAAAKASGIYLGVVQMYGSNGGLIGRKTLKVMVTH